MTGPEIVPNPRVDILVTDPGGRTRRSTTYSGAIRPGPSPVLHVRGSASLRWDSGIGPHAVALFVPDGLPYLADGLGDAYLAPELSLQGMYENAYIESVSARFAPDPRGPTEAWVELAFTYVGRPQTSFAYRVTAVVPSDAVSPAPS